GHRRQGPAQVRPDRQDRHRAGAARRRLPLPGLPGLVRRHLPGERPAAGGDRHDRPSAGRVLRRPHRCADDRGHAPAGAVRPPERDALRGERDQGAVTETAALVASLRRAGLLGSVPPVLPAFTGLTTDSRSAGPGVLFVAVRGSRSDGHRFVADAVARGAAGLVVERPVEAPAPQIVVHDGRRAALALARAWYDDPAAAMTLVGITGTNGKTTTTGLVRHLLNTDGATGSIGTLGAFDGAGNAVPSTA